MNLVKKGRRQMMRKAERGLSWKKLSECIHKESDLTASETTTILKDIMHLAQGLVGEESTSEVVEHAACTAFSILYNCDQVTHRELRQIGSQFGSISKPVVDDFHKVVMKISSHVPEEVLSAALNPAEEDAVKQFGDSFKFSFDSLLLDVDDTQEFEAISDKASVWSLDFSYTNNGTDTTSSDPSSEYRSDETVNNLSWLRKEVEKAVGPSGSSSLGLSVEGLCSTLISELKSSKSSDELQNELFDLLGFNCFELIERLLKNRKELISAARRGEAFARITDHKKERAKTGPAYSSQVTIQSEKEKELSKQIRREEKKLARKEAKLRKEDQDEELEFDPDYLRMQREIALQEARNEPLFKYPRQSGAGYQRYPFVFDSMAEAQRSSSFVAGAKLSLPVGFQQKQNKIYEEVHLPPSSSAPANIGSELVPISMLDEIGQMAFRGTKKLNRIQSVVFETAYYTNENLLICAPTGAGKTNIAMLTIVHQIKQHIEAGVIKKDSFKIIYVAPMKALAAEMVRNFGARLAPLGIQVKEMTGDMQLTKSEIVKTQMIVTTPEKWDVVTRKSTGDVALTQLVKLLILDEVHLLHDDRGAVIESLVARTLRQVESTQSMIRIIGLSATLPNYLDVARFLGVNPYKGLFFFDGRFRPVPLGQRFIGVKSVNPMQQRRDMDEACYEKVLDMVGEGHQVMVFVHARNSTVHTASKLQEIAKRNGEIGLFQPEQSPELGTAAKQVSKSRNKQLKELFIDGFSIHHAGMLRQDRSLVERLFAEGHIKVLCCTATLAWGVNLPAHAVVIKGTQIYDANRGAFKDLGILDVMQIFGRAGRPQYDTFGEGTIITTHDRLSKYLALMTRQNPIESQFHSKLADNLNAEISLGTVSNVEDAVKWLSYTYFYVRMLLNPLVYGISYKQTQDDPDLLNHRKELIIDAAKNLDKAEMIRFVEHTGDLHATDKGRIASHYYITYATIETFNEKFRMLMNEAEVFAMVSLAEEFQQIKVRDDELVELDRHHGDDCAVPATGGSENTQGKVNILLQSFISRGYMDSFSLVSDSAYVAQNSGRIMRALFEIALKNGWPLATSLLLKLTKMVDRRLWDFENPLRQFPHLNEEIFRKLEKKDMTIDHLREMTASEIGHMIHYVRKGDTIKQAVNQLPSISLEATLQPITRTVLKVCLTITPEFKWNDRVHGNVSESWWIWVEDPENNHIYHSEYFILQKKQVQNEEPQSLVFTIPLFEPLPSQYYIKAVSERWLGSETIHPLSFQHLILPERHPPHTELLDLTPLPITALNNPNYEMLYKFSHFNPVQTQIFHTLYHTNYNVLLGAPTGSGKTVAAEIAMFRVFNEQPQSKIVYIAPLKALVRERINDWKVRLEQALNKTVVELTGDVAPDIRAIAKADVIVTTPEKWDGVSRSWQTRHYVQAVSVLIIDEIHLLGDERGPVLEVIVSRTNFISSHTTRPVRVIGLSTALANAKDLADWLGIKQVGLFNFRPQVRPVPLDVHISGFPGKHYCPRMATMNKPTFQAIKVHSPEKPVLIFVSSRRQTRLTALDLIAFLAAEDNPKMWLHMSDSEMDHIIDTVKDTNLKLTLAFGIGIHHAGLHERDRRTTEELFVNQKIQVLIATSTLAWGVNFPAHLVVVKGTEFFDGKTKRYVDFPITDVLQMMGRAGRPQFDDHGTAVILVHDVKKHFYKKFLYEPFPVESNLLDVLPEHINAEVVAGTITSKQDALDYLTWTYFFRRLVMNPSFYHLEDTDHNSINTFLSQLVERSVVDLAYAYCLEIGDDNRTLEATTLGRIASYYYLHHSTVKMFRDNMGSDCSTSELLNVLSDAHEYEDLPVRHNEDSINSTLATKLPLPVNEHTFDSPHTKTHLLLQAHFCREHLPMSDYHTDTKSVLDQAIRILQAMIDVAADEGWLITALRVMNLIQMVLQGRWNHQCPLLILPHIETHLLHCFRNPERKGKTLIDNLPELLTVSSGKRHHLVKMLTPELTDNQVEEIWEVIQKLPVIDIRLHVKGWWADSNQEEKKKVEGAIKGFPQDDQYITVHADQEYVLEIDLTRISSRRHKLDQKAYSPRFPKAKTEGWFIVLGDIENKELLALKRVGFVQSRSTVQLSFYTPENPGRAIYSLYVMSDSYLGLDQQYIICLDVIEADIGAQLNTEILEDDEEMPEN